MLRHRAQQVQDGRRKGPRCREVRLRLLELHAGGKPALQKEEDRLLERRMRGEVADVVPAVHETSALAVYGADLRLVHVDVIETSINLRSREGRLHPRRPPGLVGPGQSLRRRAEARDRISSRIVGPGMPSTARGGRY